MNNYEFNQTVGAKDQKIVFSNKQKLHKRELLFIFFHLY